MAAAMYCLRRSIDTERAANEVIAYYSTQLADLVGSAYKDASLDQLADFWLDESSTSRPSSAMS